jgi:hypothetical protein
VFSGQCNDWRNYFTEQQSAELRGAYRVSLGAFNHQLKYITRCSLSKEGCNDNGNNTNTNTSGTDNDHLSPSDNCGHVEKPRMANSSEKKAHNSGNGSAEVTHCDDNGNDSNDDNDNDDNSSHTCNNSQGVDCDVGNISISCSEGGK